MSTPTMPDARALLDGIHGPISHVLHIALSEMPGLRTYAARITIVQFLTTRSPDPWRVTRSATGDRTDAGS